MPIEDRGEGAPSRVTFLDVQIDPLEMDDVLRRLARAPNTAPFSYVVTPNVDHVVKLSERGDTNDALRAAYARASIRICDSRILAALARLRGIRLPVVPGSDLTTRLFADVIQPGDRIALVGGTPETLTALRRQYPGIDFHQHIPPMGMRNNRAAMESAADFVAATNPRFAFLAVGSPQQELLGALIAERKGATGIGLCVGGSIDFLTGASRRAPRAMQKMGLEWAHRLLSDPRRMWRRYLVEGPRIFWIAARWRPDAGR